MFHRGLTEDRIEVLDRACGRARRTGVHGETGHVDAEPENFWWPSRRVPRPSPLSPRTRPPLPVRPLPARAALHARPRTKVAREARTGRPRPLRLALRLGH